MENELENHLLMFEFCLSLLKKKREPNLIEEKDGKKIEIEKKSNFIN
jgi:hypothetical protein